MNCIVQTRDVAVDIVGTLLGGFQLLQHDFNMRKTRKSKETYRTQELAKKAYFDATVTWGEWI